MSAQSAARARQVLRLPRGGRILAPAGAEKQESDEKDRLERERRKPEEKARLETGQRQREEKERVGTEHRGTEAKECQRPAR